MKIVIPGGSGQVGTLLARAFHADGQEVVVLSRRLSDAPWRTVVWDGETQGDWVGEIDGADAVINLAGRSVNCRYTPRNRRLIRESRVNSTRAVGDAIRQANCPPRVWLQASSATRYRHRYDAPNDETDAHVTDIEIPMPDTWRFSMGVVQDWEQAMNDAETPDTRKVALRSAMVMSPDRGGIFDVLLGLVRHGLGGQSGDGRQYVSWIHAQDFVRSIQWLLAHEDFTGPVNLCAPNPLPNAAFMRSLRAAWGIWFGLPATTWMLELGTRVLQTETELVLKSRRVVPGRLQEAGFSFSFPEWPDAARDLCARWREGEEKGKPDERTRDA